MSDNNDLSFGIVTLVFSKYYTEGLCIPSRNSIIPFAILIEAVPSPKAVLGEDVSGLFFRLSMAIL